MENRFAIVQEHLDRARRGLIAYIASVVVLSAACFWRSESILLALVRLLGKPLVAYEPAEAFLTLVSLSVYGGFALSLPFGAWLLWRGVAGRLFPEKRGWAGPVVLAATGLFVLGAGVCYELLLPAGIGFLAGFENGEIRALLSARRFISFCGTMTLALGLAFELPLVSFFLARLGLLTPGFFRKRWRHAVLACTVASAVITPTPDIYNMMLMMLPLMGVYLASFAVVLLFSPARRGPAAEEASGTES